MMDLPASRARLEMSVLLVEPEGMAGMEKEASRAIPASKDPRVCPVARDAWDP